ncbi:hypothetical protein LTR53_012052 [Teratosphaeriaceae sp. CCFEE 6253]|nr:hypothetical protein LTR53_012052 [Teratosphaeriaceae sp. CCFEE 6253]
MSRYGGGPRSSAGDLGREIPQRWDRDRFERFGNRGPPAQQFEEEYRFTERDRPGRRDIAVADRIDERGPGGSYHERDRYVEEDRFTPGSARPRRRTDRELFGDVDPREIAEMAMTPYRRKSIGRQEDVEYERRAAPPRPGLLRRQSSLDTFDRRPARYEKEDYRMPAYTPVPLPIRRHEDIYEEAPRYRAPEDYREVEIQRERSVHRHRGGDARSEAPSRKAPSTRAKSVTTRRTSPSSASSESFEEVEREESIRAESIRESIAETKRGFKKGKTRMPKRLVRSEAIQDLGYPYDEEDNFYVLRIALEKDQIDEVIKISEQYKEGGNKTVYRFEERIHEQTPAPLPPPPMGEREEIVKTEWVNPPSVIFEGARSERARTVRAASPARTTVTRRTSPARTVAPSMRARSRRPSSPGTYVEERRTVIEERAPMPPPPVSIPVPEYYEDRRTVIEERMPPPPPPGAPPMPGALVIRERRDYRSDRDIQSEIRQLEAEQRALRLEREAEQKRDMALRLRERPGYLEEDYQLVEYREGGRRRGDREMLEIAEREKSPKREVVRVEKDRKGRMALVRSAH